MKNWYIYSKKADFNKIAEQFHISPMLARILRNRDIMTEEEIREYLFGDLSMMYDPFLLRGVREACELLADAIYEKQKIRIVGDYDIDGVCASYILKTAIQSFGGIADVAIPDRVEDGYGINVHMVEAAYDDGVKLLLTCDNGIRAFEPALKAKMLGMKMIITDHHEVPDALPQADAVIDPHCKDSGYPYPDLCGAAVAYKLMQALHIFLSRQMSGRDCFLPTAADAALPSDAGKQEEAAKRMWDELLMFAGFATIGDIVPLKGENRIFAKEGIQRLRCCTNIGINALIHVKQIKKDELDAYHIGFLLGPCINSAGRLKEAGMALRLLECRDEAEAFSFAQELSALNEERKQLTEKYTAQAMQSLNDRVKRQGKVDAVLGVFLPDAHESVAGIIAGRIREQFYRPSFVVTNSEQGLKGSGRSIEGYNMIQEISRYPDFFVKYGGHAMACGFTLKKGTFHDLVDTLNKACPLTDADLTEKKWIDMQLPVEYVSEAFIDELEMLKPFGQDNKKPLFADKDLTVRSFSVLGQNRNALKLVLESRSGTRVNGILFGNPDKIAADEQFLKEAKKECAELKIACLYYPQINEFRGMRTVQLVISDLDRSN